MAELKYLNASVGGHCAIELINTQAMMQGTLTDRLQDDQAVISWAEQTFMLKPAIAGNTLNGALRYAVVALRDILRRYLTTQKLAQKDFDFINKSLSQYQSYRQISQSEGGFNSHQRIVINTSEALVGLIADAVGELIALGDLALIRKCESDECVLWFYDTTKGHKRRWCSMATCGNRHKVKKFRAK